MSSTADRSVPSYLRPQAQEIPIDHPDSRFMFNKRFVATQGSLRAFGVEVIYACLLQLQEKAQKHNGIDYHQVFQNLVDQPQGATVLWFVEDDEVVTALLPSDY